MLLVPRRLAPVSDFTEVAARVWVARYEWYDVNVTVIEGEAGLLVVDTHASTKAAQEVIADLRRLSTRPVVGLVNTHEHVDHVFGNAAFRDEYGEVPITAHEVAAANTVPHGEQVKASSVARGDHRAEEMAETPDRAGQQHLLLGRDDRSGRPRGRAGAPRARSHRRRSRRTHR